MNLQLLWYSLPGLVVLMSSILVFRWWYARLMEKLRRDIARDMHDDLGSSLSNICLLTGLVAKEFPGRGSGRAQEFLDRINAEAAKVHDSISDTITVLGTSCREVGHLAALLNRYGHELLEEKGIAFSVVLPQSLKETPLPVSKRRDLYLILKEGLHNIMRHSGASRARVQFRADPWYLYCRIEDNGSGFDASIPRAGNGLKNMRRRAEIIKGRLEITSSPGAGCVLSLCLPLRSFGFPVHIFRSGKDDLRLQKSMASLPQPTAVSNTMREAPVKA